MLLARKGRRVLLLDKGSFPSDTMSTHLIHQPGVALLKQWGLLEAVRASNCPPITRCTYDVGEFALTGSPTPAGEVAEAYCPRRKVLDSILVEAAVTAGVELRERFAVTGLTFDEDGAVTGLTGHTPGGATIREEARIVIGADGHHSSIARAVQAPAYDERPSLECGYYSYWSGVPLDGVEIYARDGRGMAAFPTNDGLACLIAGWAIRDFAEYRANLEANYLTTFELAPGLAERMRGGKREERILGSADFPNFFRKPYGPGWALVGDAGYHKDPLTAQGISDAFRDAALLADAIDEGFRGGRLLDALAGYETKRNAAAKPMFDFTCQVAAMEPPSPEMQALMSALRGNQAQINRFFGVMAGTTAFADFFSEENIGQIMAARPEPALSAR
jgi:flavin-dependent dehydrogenase